jgi:5-methylcytosine-specific restriction endonuclease McrA
MSSYKFSKEERYAVYTVHGEKCYLCTTPIDLKSMQIDHIIPETLLDDESRLREVIASFGLPNNFDINTSANWLPSCSRCNQRKLDQVFHPSPIIQVELEKAAKKAVDVETLKNKVINRRKVTNALAVLEMADRSGSLTEEDKSQLRPLIEFHFQERVEELKHNPINVTPLYEVLSETNGTLTIKGPYGLGRRPAGANIHHSWDCPNCSSIAAWNGARCVICGMLNDE